MDKKAYLFNRPNAENPAVTDSLEKVYKHSNDAKKFAKHNGWTALFVRAEGSTEWVPVSLEARTPKTPKAEV